MLIAGFALGAAPGFVVGAVAALASNLVFGQGPWTPWQMAAWGLCGVLGALLGHVFGRDLGRVPLALACGFAGLMFGAIMDVSIWVQYSGQHTLDQYLATAATSLPFNIAHAAGNVAFCLAFGPALVRALLRYRARLEVHWREAPAALGSATARAAAATRAALPPLLVLATAAALVATPAPASAQTTAASRAASYLLRAQQANGAWGDSPRARTTYIHTSWSVIGLAAAGRDPRRVARGTTSAASVLWNGARLQRATGDLERTILALAAAGLNARRTPAGDLVAKLRARQDRDGSFDRLVNLTAFGVLALRAAGTSARSAPVQRGARALERQQNADGGFNFSRRGGTQRHRRHRGRAPGAGVGARAGRARGPSRGGVHGAPPEPGRRLRAAAAADAPTRSRRRSRSRDCSRRAAIPNACAATARARRWPTCARSRPPTAASATAARARRRRSGSPRRRSPRSRAARCRCAARPPAPPLPSGRTGASADERIV